VRRALTALAILVTLTAAGVAYAAFAATTSNSGNSYSAASSFKSCDYPGTIGATAGLVNYWRLGEASGTTATDSKGTSNGTYTGGVTLGAAGAVAGDSNKAATFDGVNDSVDVADTAALRLNGSWTVEFWAKAVSYPGTGFPGLLKKGDATTANGYIVWFDRTTHFLRYKRNNVDYSFNNTDITTSGFRHFVITYDGTTLKAYENGTQTDSSTVTFGTNSGTAAFQLGTADNYGNTTIDDAAVYNTALSAATVQTHFRCGQRYRDAVLDTSGLVGYWRLSEPFGSVAFDSKSTNDGAYKNGTTLAAAGALTTTNDFGASFDAVNDYVNVPNTAALDLTSGITLEAWAKPSSVSDRLVVSKRDATGYAWEMGFATSGAAIGRINSNTNEARTATIYTTGNWYLLTMTYDQSTIRLYVNGVQQATFAYTGAITTPNIPVMIGRRGTTGSESWFSGTIDEVAIYNRALSATEVQAHYDAR
jgi:trimeric autotransporter adhesin